MKRKGTGSLLAVGLAGVAIAALVTVVIVANDTPDATTSATSRPRAEKEADPCVDDDVPYDDDIGAQEGLLQESQLPAGDWTTRSTSSCRWSLSSQDLLSIPACAAGAGGDSGVLEVEHTANARMTWIQAGGRVRLDDRVEFYPGREKPDAFRALLSGPGVADCFEAVVRRDAKQAPPVTVDDIEVSGYDLGVTPTEFEVPYLEFVQGVGITFTTKDDGEPEPVTIRVVHYGGGGVVGILTVIGTGADASAPVLDALDLATVVRTAAAHLLSRF